MGLEHDQGETKHMQLDHLNLSVTHIETSKAWYKQLFGFEEKERGVLESGVPWSIIQSEDAMLCMYERAGFVKADNLEERSAQKHTINHFAFRVRDLAAIKANVIKHNATMIYDEVHWPNSTSIYLVDPTGYEVEVTEWKDDRIQFSEGCLNQF